MKICLINQPAGLGDIFYTQRIGQHFRSLGYEIVWPVIKAYDWLSNYMTSEGTHFFTEDLPFVGMELYHGRSRELILTDSFCYIPLRFASFHPNAAGLEILEAKYGMLNMLPEASRWEESFTFKRNSEKEKSLFYDVLGLKDGEDFIFSNSWIGSPDGLNMQRLGHVNFDNKGIRVVEHDAFIGGGIGTYTIFDWSLVLERAKQIHTPNTGMCFLIDRLDTQADKEHKFMYHRDKNNSHGNSINDNWNYTKNSLNPSKWTYMDN
jgi:hypothetical protein